MFWPFRLRSARVRVQPSKIGMGVFAIRPFRPGDRIGEAKGRVIKDPDYGSEYCMQLDGHEVLEPDPPFRFLNHSCDPNARLVLYYGRKFLWRRLPSRMCIEAVRAIRPGEEITIDYQWPAEDPIRCACGSPHCRGWIVAKEHATTLKKPELVAAGVESAAVVSEE